MSRLLEQTLAGLTSGDLEAIQTAASFFEWAHGFRSGLINPAVASEAVDEDDLRRLEGALIGLAQGAGPESGPAAWALGKRADPRLVGPLCTALRSGLDRRDDHLVYQAMIALEDSGEPAFEGGSERSSLAIEQNRRGAERYLNRRVD